uniref:WGS project CAEQ00000000 data, annotated contig 512 n=1 Tax=Trypanosoma congolense (strain IL3000) TaxID=1068625 RepID=F9WGK7_TRYCI|nr:unnamed protein product [Trypanosoma congolense IL3000]
MDNGRIGWILDNRTKFYEVLDVPNDASQKTIRRKYHSLALQLHPDKNPSDSRAREAFCVVMRAYEVLSNEEKRYIYDSCGAEALTALESGDLFSPTKFVVHIGRFLLAKVLILGAYRIHATETLSAMFVWADQFLPRRPEDAFERARMRERKSSRRVAERVFLTSLLLSICVGCMAYSAGPLREWNKKGTDVDKYGPLSSSGGRGDDKGASFVFAVAGKEGQRDVSVWRPSTTREEEARTLVQHWISDVCAQQRLLLWASRERFEKTATLRVRRELKAVLSPNRSPKRKWASRRWRPKFSETFSVSSADHLFSASPLCVPFS